MEVPGIKVLIVDNYDSFTYNIAHSVRSYQGSNLQIIKANDINLKDIGSFDKIIFSPGPDLPRSGNIMEQIMDTYSDYKSILGICLGLQAIVLHSGGKLINLEEVVHGKKLSIKTTGTYSEVLKGIPSPFEAGLYLSWTTDPKFIPDSLYVTAVSEHGSIMGVRHKTNDIEGVQFHPESIMTPLGVKMIHNWLKS